MYIWSIQVLFPRVCVCVCVCVLVAQSCPTLCDPMDCSSPGSSVCGILQQEYWSELPFLSPGDLPDPGIEPGLPRFRQTLYPLSHQGGPQLESRPHNCNLRKLHPAKKTQLNSAICNHMDGPRDCQTKWSKSDKTNII